MEGSGRSFLRGSHSLYDIIQSSLTDSFHPVSSGAYALGEDYRYTVEAFRDMIAHLKPQGFLVASRWLQEDPSEWLRTFSLAVTALEEENLDPKTQIAALRGYNAGTLFVKKSPFTAVELEELREFASEKAFDLVYLPGISPTEVNRYNILPEPIYYTTFTAFLDAESKQAFYRDYPYDVSPPTDDHPFFGHYFKWSQLDEIIANFGLTWQPFGGAGYLVILLIFLLAFFLAGVLILLPVLVKKQRGSQLQAKHIPVYFALIGLAYMLVEMPLIQRFILYLDQPAYAFATVLFSILLFSGLGSRYGNRRISQTSALILLTILLSLQLICLPWLLHISLGLKLPLRVLISILLIAPIGFLMGIPFPAGLNWISTRARGENEPYYSWMVAYVWAVNGACSVVASILASLISLSYGFSVTSAVGLACYSIAAYISRKIQHPKHVETVINS